MPALNAPAKAAYSFLFIQMMFFSAWIVGQNAKSNCILQEVQVTLYRKCMVSLKR